MYVIEIAAPTWRREEGWPINPSPEEEKDGQSTQAQCHSMPPLPLKPASPLSQSYYPFIHFYLVINGVKFGKNNAINEPRCLSHRMVSQGSVELDLKRWKGNIRTTHLICQSLRCKGNWAQTLTSWSTASLPTKASPTNSTKSGVLTVISLARAVIRGALSCMRPAVSTSTTSNPWLRARERKTVNSEHVTLTHTHYQLLKIFYPGYVKSHPTVTHAHCQLPKMSKCGLLGKPTLFSYPDCPILSHHQNHSGKGQK